MREFVEMRNNIRDLKNINDGCRAFILANGPSLSDFDLSKIKEGDIIIGMNSSTLLESSQGVTSDYYVVSDVRFITNTRKRNCATNMLHEDTVRVFREEIKAHDEQDYFDRTYYIKSLGRDGFSSDLEFGYYFGCSTTMLAVQLAYYIGCKQIYLLGVDLNYMSGRMRFYDEDVIEFPDPFISVQIFNIKNAFHYLSKSGVDLINCSKYSFVRPYLPYTDFRYIF